MRTEQFEKEIKMLASMVGSFQSDDLFNQEYELLFLKIQADTDMTRRYAAAQRLQKLGMLQVEFLTNEWLKAKREHEYVQ